LLSAALFTACDFETSYASGLWLHFYILQSHRISYGFSVMIQKQCFRVVQLFAQMSNISMRKTLERIRKSCSFSENDFKHEITLTKNLLRKESKLPISLQQFFSFIAIAYLKICVWLLLVTVTLPATNASCERYFSKMKWWKQFPEIPWPVKDWVTLIDPLSVERYELKNRFRWFRWWIWQSTLQSKD